jgi:hypothetical protein
MAGTILVIVGLVTAAVLIVFSKRREDADAIQKQIAAGNADLIKTRDIRIADLSDEMAEKDSDLESLGVEYKTLVAINIDKLFEYYGRYKHEEEYREKLEACLLRANKKIRAFGSESDVEPMPKRPEISSNA